MRIDRRFSAVLLAVMALVGCPDKDAPSAQNAPTAPPAPAPAATPAAPVPAAPPTAAPAPAQAVFRAEELDQMMAPIALYPDSLLAQVLMASTYPGNVADAVAWSKANPKASGDAAVRQVADQPWDPSVQSLVAFPAVLDTLGQDPAWVQRIGDAFLAQPDAVMDSVQRLRRQAQAAGHLESNEQQRVTVQSAAPGGPTTVVQTEAPSSTTTVVQAPPAEQTIIIEPADPQVVYVPSYNPSTVYGTWPNPSYPPAYYPPSPGYYLGSALAAGLAFGVGVGIVNSLWGDCDWGGGDVDIDVNRYNNINSNRQINANQNKWQHNAANRNGVPYRDRSSREQYGQRLAGSEQRDALRGREPARGAERERASQTLSQRGLDAPASSNREARERAQSAERERASQTLGQRGIESPATSNREARERAQTADRGMREQSQARERSQASQRPQASAQPRQRTQSSAPARQQARQQHSSAQGSRNNAFADARNPSRSQASANRGQTSRASASRPQAERSSGRSVQRSAPSSSRGSARGGGRGR